MIIRYLISAMKFVAAAPVLLSMQVSAATNPVTDFALECYDGNKWGIRHIYELSGSTLRGYTLVSGEDKNVFMTTSHAVATVEDAQHENMGATFFFQTITVHGIPGGSWSDKALAKHEFSGGSRVRSRIWDEAKHTEEIATLDKVGRLSFANSNTKELKGCKLTRPAR